VETSWKKFTLLSEHASSSVAPTISMEIASSNSARVCARTMHCCYIYNALFPSINNERRTRVFVIGNTFFIFITKQKPYSHYKKWYAYILPKREKLHKLILSKLAKKS
jgi:hypothetical protein